jgi:DNA-directed RNA polymerase subunit M/transcription elongation factor TFIIS
VQFCPKCDNVLLVKRKGKGKVLQCPSCGHEMPFKEEHKKLYTMAKVIEHGAKDLTHVTEEKTTPTVTDDDRDLIDDSHEVEFTED